MKGLRPAAAAIPLLTLVLALVIGGCGGSNAATGPNGSSDQLQVVATTTWHSDLARIIGGEHVSVEGLMEPGVDPHLYTARAGDVESLADADLAVRNGLELEGKLDEVFEHVARTVPVITVGEAVPTAERIPIEGSQEFDPHIWFDPEAWTHAATAVADGFAEADPENAASYAANLKEFKATAAATAAKVKAMTATVPKRSRVLVTSHDAFSYFGRAFGFEVAPIQGKSTATEATTADIERVAKIVADAELRAVFIETSVPEQTIDAVLASAARQGQETALGGELLGDSLGSPGTPEEAWAGALMHNAETIINGLGAGNDTG